jgi:hypothetical protein
MARPSMLLCPVHACTNGRRRSQVMCPACWSRVPQFVKEDVYREFRSHPGSEAHRRAVFAAVRAASDSGSALESGSAANRKR